MSNECKVAVSALSSEELEDIRWRLNHTSLPPWKAVSMTKGDAGDVQISTGSGRLAISTHTPLEREDYEFFINARQDVFLLLEEVLRLRAISSLDDLQSGSAHFHRNELPRNELYDIEKRASAASPGPWETLHHPHGNLIGLIRGDKRVINFSGIGDNVQWAYDNIFIAHARRDIPLLLEEVKRLNTCLQTLQRQYMWHMPVS